MQDEDLGDRVFHDEHVVHLTKLAEILPQPLLACLQTFQSSNGWDIVVKMPPPPPTPPKNTQCDKKNYLPAEPAHKKFCEHRLSSSDLLNIIFIISNYHLETLWIQFRKSRLFTWLVFDIITKRTFLLNSICRQKLIWECLSKDNKLRFSFAHIKVLEYLKSCKPRFPRRSQGPPCLLSGPCNRLTVKFLSLNNFLKKERNKTCMLKNILISYLKMVLFENIKFTSLLFPPGQPLQLWATTLMF